MIPLDVDVKLEKTQPIIKELGIPSSVHITVVIYQDSATITFKDHVL